MKIKYNEEGWGQREKYIVIKYKWAKWQSFGG